MRRYLFVAGAVMAGIILTPQARPGAAAATVGEYADQTDEAAARSLARRLRRHGYWGFGRFRREKGHLYLQAYRSPGAPVMVKMAMATGRIVAVKKFSRRHRRRGVGLPGADRMLADAGRRETRRRRV